MNMNSININTNINIINTNIIHNININRFMDCLFGDESSGGSLLGL